MPLLLKNANFEQAPAFTAAQTALNSRWIDGTAAGSTTNAQYGWATYNYAGGYTAQFDSTTSIMGTTSLKLATTATASSVGIANHDLTAPLFAMNPIPCQSSEDYTITGWMKTTLTSGVATSGAFMRIGQWTSDGVSSAGASVDSTKVVTTTSWTKYTWTLTTSTTARFLTVEMRVLGSDGTGTLILAAWFDDIRITAGPYQNNYQAVKTLDGMSSSGGIQ